jgi:hypothetical protein
LKTLDEVEARIIVNASSTPGDVTNSFIIKAAGSYYLTGSITGVAGKHGISIQANDVTLDLNGFALIGGGTGPVASTYRTHSWDSISTTAACRPLPPCWRQNCASRTPDDWILPKDSRGYSKSIWALSGVVSAKQTSTPIRRTGFPVRAKAWARRDPRRIHKLLFVFYHPQKSSARESFSRQNFNLDDHFDRSFLFMAMKGKLRN